MVMQRTHRIGWPAAVIVMLQCLLFVFTVCTSTASATALRARARTPTPDMSTASAVATVTVDTSKVLATVDPEYLSFNFDWWDDAAFYPAWMHSSIQNMSLNADLRFLASQLAPAHLRIGGTHGDIIVYQSPDFPECPSVPVPGNYCLTMERWDEINMFAKEAGLTIVFGLNAMYGRPNATSRMDLSNLQAFLKYTSQQRHYPIWGFEFGNELNLGHGGYACDPQPYAEDLRAVRQLIDLYWGDLPAEQRPRLVANDGTPDVKYWQELIPLISDVIDAATWHLYIGFGGNPELPTYAFNRTFLQRVDMFSAAMLQAAGAYQTKGAFWVGETAMAYGSGQNHTTNTFLSGPWWIYQLGTLAATHRVQCRQTLQGGYYELVDKWTYKPNPDWWTALLWKRLMGSTVLPTNSSSDSVLAFAHCSPAGDRAGLAFINLSDETYNVALRGVDPVPREEYHLSPVGAENSQVVALNGVTLQYKDGQLTPLRPKLVVDAAQPLVLAPRSYGFVALPVGARSVCRGRV